MIFQQLDSLNIPYSVVMAFQVAKAITQQMHKEYFILGLSEDKNMLVSLGFRWNSSFKVYYYNLSESEIMAFKAISERYKLVCRTPDGRVYEQRNCSFKQAYDACKEAIYQS